MTTARRAGMIAATLLCAAFAAPATASTYRLADAEITTAAETKALAAAGIMDTAQLASRTATGEARKALAAATKLPAERLDALATLADLLRVDGIGPTMARALQRVGVRTLAHLRTETPEALERRLGVDAKESAKPGTEPAPVPPKELLARWIGAARELPLRYEQ